eukprot:805350-Pelagomonas_calceolata.AAC.6
MLVLLQAIAAFPYIYCTHMRASAPPSMPDLLQANGANSLSPRSQAEQQSSNSPGASGGGATGGGVGFVDGPKDHAGIKAGNEGGGTKSVGGATGATKAGVADLVNGREPGNHRGALSRLIKALGRQVGGGCCLRGSVRSSFAVPHLHAVQGGLRWADLA